jgi:gamma-glutamylcyclotransferase (GGCT)/AIG2-like uncharacterized protein YtfP
MTRLLIARVWSGAPERPGLRLVGAAKIRGDLYSIGSAFPAFVTGAGEIVGEVWEAANDAILRGALHVTDAIEGYRERPDGSPDPWSMYLREEHPLIDDADGRTVLVYRWNADRRRGMAGLTPIPSGSWREHTRTSPAFSWMADREPEPVDYDADEPDGTMLLDDGSTVILDWKTTADR